MKEYIRLDLGETQCKVIPRISCEGQKRNAIRNGQGGLVKEIESVRKKPCDTRL